MAIKGKDFILNPKKLESEYNLVEVTEWVDFNTKEHLGFKYTVLFPKLKFERIQVEIKGSYPIVSNEELEEEGQILVAFENLLTWASNYGSRLSVKASADGIKRLE